MSDLRSEAGRYGRVIVDLGCGDGRYAYRLARRNPSWLCIGVDADAAAMAQVAYRATRKPSRGGMPNARFLRMALDELPGPLVGLADEIHVNLPWGSLLSAMLGRDPGALRRIARVGKTGASFRAVVNDSALAARGLTEELGRLYAPAGIRIHRVWRSVEPPSTSWGKRLGNGRPIAVVRLDGVVTPSRTENPPTWMPNSPSESRVARFPVP